MATTDYVNPFTAINPSDFGEGKTAYEVMMAGEKQKQAQPFVDMARQQQQMQIQKEQQGLQEFLSPEAQKSRMTGFGADTAKHQNIIDTTPWKTRTEIDTAQSQLELSSETLRKNKAELRQHALAAENHPISELYGSLGAVGENYDKMPPEMQKAAFAGTISMWKQKYPGEKLPQEFLDALQHSDNPKQMEHIFKTASYMDLEGRKLKNARDISAATNAASVEGHKISAGGSVAAAGVTAAQSGANAELVYGSKAQTAANSRAQHIQGAVDKALTSLPYMQAQTPEEKTKILDDAEKRASRIYETYGMGKTNTPVPTGRVVVKDKNGKPVGHIPNTPEQRKLAQDKGYTVEAK